MKETPSNTPALAPELLPAFAIFVKEMDGHLKAFEEILAKLDPRSTTKTVADLEECLPLIVHRCHLIKGGAGFFQLAEMKSYAAEAEKYFQNSGKSSPTELAEELQKVVGTFSEQINLLRSAF